MSPFDVPLVFALLNCCSGEIEAEFPYFARMRDLIAERPNLVPVGLGNGRAVIDASVFANRAAGGNDQRAASGEGLEDPQAASEHTQRSSRTTPTSDDDGDDLLRDVDDDDDDEPTEKGKRDQSVVSTAKRAKENKKAAHAIERTPKSSQPQALAKTVSKSQSSVSMTKRKRGIEDSFSAIAVAEEETKQGELSVAKARLEMERKFVQAKLDIAKAKLEDKRLKREARMREKEQEHERKMLRMRQKMSEPGPTAGTGGGSVPQTVITPAPPTSGRQNISYQPTGYTGHHQMMIGPSASEGFQMVDGCNDVNAQLGCDTSQTGNMLFAPRSRVPPELNSPSEGRTSSPAIADFGLEFSMPVDTRSSTPGSGYETTSITTNFSTAGTGSFETTFPKF